MRRCLATAFLALLGPAPGGALQAGEDTPPPGRYAIRAGKAVVLAKERGTLDDALILVSGGKIEALLEDPSGDRAAPAGYEEIPAREAWVTPGFVDLHSHIGGSDINDMVYPTNPGLRVLDNIRPDNPRLRAAVAGGVTTVLFIPGSGTNMSGFGALMKTAGATLDEVLIRFPGALKIAQGGNPERQGGDLGRHSMGMNYLIRGTLEEGRRYTSAWDEYEAGKRPEPPPRNPRLENFRGLFHREFPVVVHTQGYLLIQSTLRILADEMGLWVVIDHGCFDSPRLAAETVARGVAVVSGPRGFRYNTELGRIEGQAAKWREGGVQSLGLNTDSPVVPQEELFFQGSMAVRYGLDHLAALRALTIEPAKAVGIDKRCGSLEAGKDADLVIWTGDPLDVRQHVLQVLVNGKIAYDVRREPRRF